MDPLSGSQWSAPGTVAGFARSAPNAVLMAFAEAELAGARGERVLDIGCGAGRNAVPLARLGWSMVGFREALDEAARVATPGAALFVFTFSRNTLPVETQPVPGESFVFTQFSGEPQCFLTERQLDAQLARAGFVRDSAVPFHEYNLPRPGQLHTGKMPVIYEALFRRESPILKA